LRSVQCAVTDIMDPLLRKLIPALAAVAAAVNLSAQTAVSRYVVSTRKPLGITRLPMLQDAGLAQAHEVRRFEYLDAFAVELTDAEAAALRQSPDVRYVDPVVERHLIDGAQTLSSAPSKVSSEASHYNSKQTIPWGIAETHAPDVWNVTRGSGINVVLIDTGIDVTQPELSGAYAGGYNTFDPTAQPIDDNGHGTHVAGTVAAADNAFGVVGMAPQVKIWSVKVLDKSGHGDTAQVQDGINWVLGMKRQLGGDWIISLSLGAALPTPSEKEAFQKAYDNGILAVAAAGNSGLAALEYPGAYETVLAVGAIDQNEVRASFSSYGNNLGLMAPGVGVLSTARLGSIPTTDIQTDNNLGLKAYSFKGSPLKDVWAPYVYCKTGEAGDFPPEVAGKIAVIQRGCGDDGSYCGYSFNEKVKNAMAAGAVAAVIFNSPTGADDLDRWSLVRLDCDNTDCHDYQPDLDYPWILTVGLTFEDGQRLLNSNAQTMVESYRLEDYTTLSGTSMATPHVSGAAALLWSLVPNATAREIRNALLAGARDLGPGGYDPKYGFGELDVLASAKILAPGVFGLPAPPPPTKRRS
jgi:subtilisin family serine protease